MACERRLRVVLKVFAATVVFIALRMFIVVLVLRFGLPPAMIGNFIWFGLILLLILPGRWHYLPISVATVISLVSVHAIGEERYNAMTTIITSQLVLVLISEIILFHINALKKSNKTLIEAKQIAENATKKKYVFMAYMSHEIRNPLAGIIGMTDLLLESSRGDEKRFLGMIRESSQALQRFIEDLLDLSVMEADGVVLQREAVNVHDFLYDLCTVHGVDAANRGISFHSDIQCDDGVYLLDRVRFRQIVGNLLSNAFKFTPKGGIVRFGALCLRDSNSAVRLRLNVSDTGPGISAKEQELIFDSFYRSDSSKNGGAGLGLFIVKKMVDVFGGVIDVKSKAGDGAEFVVELPLEATPAGNAVEDILIEKQKPVAQRADGRTILVADDNTINAAYMRILLEKEGFTVDVAQDGIAAVELFEKKLHDIVILDISMPKKTGDEALAEIRELSVRHKHRLYSIAVTGFVNEPERTMISTAGFNSILFKPVDSKLLLSILGSCNTEA